MIQPVTRLEIAEAVRSAFANGGASRTQILAAAIANQARPETIEVVTRLPERPYPRLNEIWAELHGVPVGA